MRVMTFADAEAAEPCTEVTHRSKRRFESTDDMAETKLLAEVDDTLLTPHYSFLTAFQCGPVGSCVLILLMD